MNTTNLARSGSFALGPYLRARTTDWERPLARIKVGGKNFPIWLVQFVALDRSGGPTEYPYLTVRRKIDISAIPIRNRVASGRSIRYLDPEAVEVIIRREKLYKEGTERSNPKS